MSWGFDNSAVEKGQRVSEGEYCHWLQKYCVKGIGQDDSSQFINKGGEAGD